MVNKVLGSVAEQVALYLLVLLGENVEPIAYGGIFT